jgi:hypothetical protein
MIVTFILFCIYAILEGVRDAVVFSEYYRKWNEHILLWTSRATAGAGMLWPYFMYAGLSETIRVGIAMVLAFAFCQLSAYYTTYQKLGHAYYDFFSKSSTTDAKINLNFIQRTTLFAIAVCLVMSLSL